MKVLNSINGIEFTTDKKDEVNEFPTLYKRDKLNRISFWRIYVIDDMYYRESGITTGKTKEYAPVICTSKNVGRSNQTTPEEQALLEAFSEWKHKIKQLYTENINEKVAVGSETVSDKLRPMLAEKYTEKKKHVKWPCAISPKLDGVRVMIYHENNDITIISRLGKKYKFLDGIREEAKLIFDVHDCVLDGELYTHTLPFNSISGIARSTNTPHKYDDKLEVYIFDLYFPNNPTISYFDRMKVMREICKTNHKRIRFLFYEEAKTENDIIEKHAKYVSEGYEGLIIRNLDSPYKLGRRVTDLLKYKEFEDAEFTVIDVIDGLGSEKGAAIFVCLTDENEKFTVRPRGTIEKRKKQFMNKKLFIGKKLTVRYQPINEIALPRFPVGIKFDKAIEEKLEAIDIRDYE